MKVKAINYSFVKQAQSKTNKLKMTQTVKKPYIKKKPFERNIKLDKIELDKFELDKDKDKRVAEYLKQMQKQEEKPMVLIPPLEYHIPVQLRIPHKNKIIVII